jgi:hypothetical protein
MRTFLKWVDVAGLVLLRFIQVSMLFGARHLPTQPMVRIMKQWLATLYLKRQGSQIEARHTLTAHYRTERSARAAVERLARQAGFTITKPTLIKEIKA